MGVSLLLLKSLHCGYLCLRFSSPDFELLCLVPWCHSHSSCCHVFHLVGTQEIVVELNDYVALRKYDLKTLQIN